MNELVREVMNETGIYTEGMPEEKLRDLENKSEKIAKEWNNLKITNDFIFCKVMQDKELLAGLIRIIIPELEFKDFELTSQKEINIGNDIHGVRFDVFVKSNKGTVIDIEMQVIDLRNMPMRMRYYGSMSDVVTLEKGEHYEDLNDRYIITICTFDYYKKGLHRYTFTNRCHEINNLEMGDGTTNILLNASGTEEDVHGTLKEFLNYVAGKTTDDEYVKKLEEAVNKARKNKEWRREFVMLSMRDMDKRKEGIIEGHKEGINDEQHRIIERLLKKGKSVEEVADLCGYSLELIKEVQNIISE